MKTEEEIKDKIAEAEKWIDDMMKRPTSERDDSFWFDLIKYRNAQKALEWVMSNENYLDQNDIDNAIEWEDTCRYASTIF